VLLVPHRTSPSASVRLLRVDATHLSQLLIGSGVTLWRAHLLWGGRPGCGSPSASPSSSTSVGPPPPALPSPAHAERAPPAGCYVFAAFAHYDVLTDGPLPELGRGTNKLLLGGNILASLATALSNLAATALIGYKIWYATLSVHFKTTKTERLISLALKDIPP
jgi:hypothetical protein